MTDFDPVDWATASRILFLVLGVLLGGAVAFLLVLPWLRSLSVLTGGHL